MDNEKGKQEQAGRTWRPQDADREVLKADIRRRVWSSNASPKAQFIPAKPLPTVQDEGQKTVAVYARVSTKSTDRYLLSKIRQDITLKKLRKRQIGICIRFTATRVFPGCRSRNDLRFYK